MLFTKLKTFLLITLCLCLLASGSTTVFGKHNKDLDQTVRLSGLANVWGLLKYYHPEVATGTIDWDAALVNAIPEVISATDYQSYNAAIENLITAAGGIDISDYNPGTPAHPNEQFFKWSKNSHLFSNTVRHKLKVLRKKHVPADNFYVQKHPYIGGAPLFSNEKAYASTPYPDENHRLLALFRFYNVIRYFFPHRDIMDNDWDQMLDVFIPRVMAAGNDLEYHKLMCEYSVLINDSHGVFTSPVLDERFFGNYYAGFFPTFVEGKMVVKDVYPVLYDNPGDLLPGDVLLKVNGEDIDDFRDRMRKYAKGSNEDTVERQLCALVIRGTTDRLNYTILRNGQTIEVSLPGHDQWTLSDEYFYDLMMQEPYKILPGNIGFVHIGSINWYGTQFVRDTMNNLMNTEAIIFDLRYYPFFPGHVVAEFLNPELTAFSKLTAIDFDYPGSFKLHTIGQAGPVEYNPDYYKGKVIILVNQDSQSAAEYFTMVLQSAPDATVIGSQTAGADGSMVTISLPGGMIARFTSQGVFYPDGTPTQRIGIVPDIVVKPTITGMQQGRDELVERAVEFVENN